MTTPKKYELTDETITLPSGQTLHRIRALIDIPRAGVRAGDVGGCVESEKNLSHKGFCWVSGNGRVFGNAQVFGNGRVSGNGRVFGNAQVSGNGRVSGIASVFGNGWVSGNGLVFGNAQVFGDGWVSGNARVTSRRHTLAIAPIGSEDGPLTVWRDLHGVYVNRGCFTGSLDDFVAAVEKAHADSQYGREYRAVIDLIRIRAASWSWDDLEAERAGACA